MTLYTIVALVIALSGSTFKTIIQLSALLSDRVQKKKDDSDEDLKFILGDLSQGNQLAKAKRRGIYIWIWFRTWGLSGFPPLLVLAAFAFTTSWIVMHNVRLPNAAIITDDGIGYYNSWLEWVIWINLVGFSLKIISGLHWNIWLMCRLNADNCYNRRRLPSQNIQREATLR